MKILEKQNENHQFIRNFCKQEGVFIIIIKLVNNILFIPKIWIFIICTFNQWLYVFVYAKIIQ